MTGVFTGPAGRPRRRQVEEVQSESDRVRGRRWACAGVEAGSGSGPCKRGRGGGQQGDQPPVRGVVAVRSLGNEEDCGEEGRIERPELRGLEARRSFVEHRPLSGLGCSVRAQ
jgi:hypothetical protein